MTDHSPGEREKQRPMLTCNGLTLGVPGRVLARDVSFEVRRGDIWAVLGANGTGKTTLVHTLAGLAPVQQGAISLTGPSGDEASRRARAALVGILLQQEDTAFYGNVLEYVLLGRFPRARSRIGWDHEDRLASHAALLSVGLAELAQRSYRSLSGGERQRARLAQVLAQDPQCFLLDEPLQHLDLRHQVAVLGLFRALARERAKAVVMVLHDVLWPTQTCTHALLLHEDGTVEAGSAPSMLTRQRLERLYGCALREIASEGAVVFAPV